MLLQQREAHEPRARDDNLEVVAATGAILDGEGLSTMWDDIWPLLIIGAVSIPLGLWVFRRGELYAKRHGKLKRSG